MFRLIVLLSADKVVSFVNWTLDRFFPEDTAPEKEEELQEEVAISELESVVFDCPQCALPASVSDPVITRKYTIQCIGDHDPIPIMEIWQ